jgi:hypothetical protein
LATVYIHIGAPKTATSTLQKVLADNHRVLLQQGVLYPRRLRHGDAHHLLVCDLIDKYQSQPMPDFWYGEQPRGAAWQSLAAEMAELGGKVHTVILSSELFFGQTANLQAMLEEIRAHLAGHDVRIVVYLRRQDQLYSSFFNQDVKGVRQWAHSAYQFYATHQIFQRDYLSMMKTWGRAFGRDNILLRPYEKEQWHNGDVVQDFCQVTAIAPLLSPQERSNASLGANQLYIKQCLNRVGFAKGHNDQVVDLVLELCPEASRSDCIYVHKGLYRTYREQWLRVNDKLAEVFLDGEPLFRQPIPNPKSLQVHQTDPDALAGFVQRTLELLRRDRLGDFAGLFARALLLLHAEQDLWHQLDQADGTLLLGLAR